MDTAAPEKGASHRQADRLPGRETDGQTDTLKINF